MVVRELYHHSLSCKSHLITRIHAQLELQNNIAEVLLGPVAEPGWSAALRHWNHVAAEGEGLKWPELSM